MLMQLTSQHQTLGYGNISTGTGTTPHLYKLANVPEAPVTALQTYEPVHSFTVKDDDKVPSLIWTILPHPGAYTGTIGVIFVVCIGVYCFKRFWFRPATPKH